MSATILLHPACLFPDIIGNRVNEMCYQAGRMRAGEDMDADLPPDMNRWRRQELSYSPVGAASFRRGYEDAWFETMYPEYPGDAA